MHLDGRETDAPKQRPGNNHRGLLGAVATVHAHYQPAAARAIYRELVVYSYTCVFIVHCCDEGRSMATETSAFLKYLLLDLSLYYHKKWANFLMSDHIYHGLK